MYTIDLDNGRFTIRYFDEEDAPLAVQIVEKDKIVPDFCKVMDVMALRLRELTESYENLSDINKTTKVSEVVDGIVSGIEKSLENASDVRMTNEDWVKSMSTEEFVNWVMYAVPKFVLNTDKAHNTLLEWMKKEYSKEDAITYTVTPPKIESSEGQR